MATVPATANVVVIGAGIVGNSLVHHLTRLGWKNVVQIDKGPLPNPGGSTGHASNFIFTVDHSREITDITLDSVAQYKEMGVFTQSGGFEIARTEERMEELRRRMSSARAWGIEAELVTEQFRLPAFAAGYAVSRGVGFRPDQHDVHGLDEVWNDHEAWIIPEMDGAGVRTVGGSVRLRSPRPGSRNRPRSAPAACNRRPHRLP